MTPSNTHPGTTARGHRRAFSCKPRAACSPPPPAAGWRIGSGHGPGSKGWKIVACCPSRSPSFPFRPPVQFPTTSRRVPTVTFGSPRPR